MPIRTMAYSPTPRPEPPPSLFVAFEVWLGAEFVGAGSPGYSDREGGVNYVWTRLLKRGARIAWGHEGDHERMTEFSSDYFWKGWVRGKKEKQRKGAAKSRAFFQCRVVDRKKRTTRFKVPMSSPWSISLASSLCPTSSKASVASWPATSRRTSSPPLVCRPGMLVRDETKLVRRTGKNGSVVWETKG